MSKPQTSDLSQDDHNANLGTTRGKSLLASSIAETGLGRSILLDKHGAVIAGNKTLAAYIDAGREDVLVIPSDGSRLIALCYN